jgi:hypothetical protein
MSGVPDAAASLRWSEKVSIDWRRESLCEHVDMNSINGLPNQ